MTAYLEPALDVHTGASYQNIFFGKVNVRSIEGLGDESHPLFLAVMETIDDIFHDGAHELRGNSSADADVTWFASTVLQWDLQDVDLDLENESLVLLTVRRSTDDHDIFVAIDRRDRWLAVVPPNVQSPARATSEVQLFLRAVLDMTPVGFPEDASFDVDLVCSTETMQAWLDDHPSITRMDISIRPSNPSKHALTRDQEEMKKLKASRLSKSFRSPESVGLDVDREYVEELGKLTGHGHADTTFIAGEQPDAPVFDSTQSPDREPLDEHESTVGGLFASLVRSFVRRLRRIRTQRA